MEKTAISNDDTLSKADKVSMFSKIDDIVEEGIHKIRKEAGLVYKEETVRHMLSLKSYLSLLSVSKMFTKEKLSLR